MEAKYYDPPTQAGDLAAIMDSLPEWWEECPVTEHRWDSSTLAHFVLYDSVKLEEYPRALLLAKDGDTIWGMALVVEMGGQCDLAEIAVRPDAPKDTGTALVIEAMAWCDDRGHRRLELYALPQAEGFYHKLGFKRQSDRFYICW